MAQTKTDVATMAEAKAVAAPMVLASFRRTIATAAGNVCGEYINIIPDTVVMPVTKK